MSNLIGLAHSLAIGVDPIPLYYEIKAAVKTPEDAFSFKFYQSILYYPKLMGDSRWRKKDEKDSSN